METEAAALLVAAISLLVAGLSLGWQIAIWLLSAGRPRAVLLHGVLGDAGAYVGPVKKDGRRNNIDQMRRQGVYGPEVLGLQITNHGRAPISLDRIAVHTKGGVMTFVPIGNLRGPDLPKQIEPGANETWYVDLADAYNLVSSSREVLKERITGVYITARFGTGKTARTRRTLAV